MNRGWGMKRAGFTIIELLIVITTIAIISTIVVVSYQAVLNNGHDTAIKGDLKKLADTITLAALDTGSYPNPGAQRTAGVVTGNSTVLPGITFKPTQDSYHASQTNLYYCVGDIDGSEVFAVLARSASGNSFAYVSEGGLRDITTIDVGQSASPTVSDPVVNCGAVGIVDPLAWSYGYNPAPEFQWFAWANAG